MKTAIPILALSAALLAGCANRVIFTTQTSLGLDVSGTAQMPNKVSLSYNRFEGSIVPRKANGEAHSVYGGLDADITFFNGHTIKQTFATGKAAMIATGAQTKDADGKASKAAINDAPLIFLTATTFGLHLAAGEKEMSPNMLLGFRRSEAAVIPVPDPAQEVRSVYADILINSTTNASGITTNFSTLGGVRIRQGFATGRAAEAKAATEEVQQKLHQAAGIEETKQSMRHLKAEAQDVVEKIGVELDRLNDNRLAQALSALKDAKVFDPGDFPNSATTPPRDLSRGIKQALGRKISGEFSDPVTVQELKTALAKLKQINN